MKMGHYPTTLIRNKTDVQINHYRVHHVYIVEAVATETRRIAIPVADIED